MGFVEHFCRHLVDLGFQFGRPLDLGGSYRWVFLDVFGATAKNETNKQLLIIMPLRSHTPNTSRNAERLGPLVFVLLPFWRPLDFGGLIRSVFLDVFGATHEKFMYCSTGVPLKWTIKKSKR